MICPILEAESLCPDCEHPFLNPMEAHETCEYCCNEVRAGKRSLENVCEHYAEDISQKYLERNYY